MSIVKSEFALALNQVATERGISPDDVIDSIEAAILAAYKKEVPEALEDETIEVQVNKNTGEAHLIKDEKDITPPGFGRIAAQTAKQVILQKIREAEKKTVISHYKNQLGTVVRGRVIRYDGFNAYVDIGRVEAVLPKEDQIRNEKYEVNDSFVFYIKEISEDKFGNSRIIVSRTDPALISELFKKEVPEIGNGTVVIKKVVRGPGDRAKIAVFSSHSGVDPVGACVGQKGVRVQTVTNEIGGDEKIDIIQWSNDDKLFIAAALSPAKIVEIEIDEKLHRAKVKVDDKNAPLAIGKSGINVNLASQLTGYEIDISQIPAPKDEKVEVQPEKETQVEAPQPAETQPEQPAKEEVAPSTVQQPPQDQPAPVQSDQPAEEKPVENKAEEQTTQEQATTNSETQQEKTQETSLEPQPTKTASE